MATMEQQYQQLQQEHQQLKETHAGVSCALLLLTEREEDAVSTAQRLQTENQQGAAAGGCHSSGSCSYSS
jgi:hypothetical protein